MIDLMIRKFEGAEKDELGTIKFRLVSEVLHVGTKPVCS